jgi:hypothetical protein
MMSDLLQREYLIIHLIPYLNLLDEVDDEVEVVEVDDEGQIILVISCLLMLLQTMISHLKLILIILIAQTLLRYVHSNVIRVIFGIE